MHSSKPKKTINMDKNKKEIRNGLEYVSQDLLFSIARMLFVVLRINRPL